MRKFFIIFLALLCFFSLGYLNIEKDPQMQQSEQIESAHASDRQVPATPQTENQPENNPVSGSSFLILGTAVLILLLLRRRAL
jgi:hypothetical protein